MLHYIYKTTAPNGEYYIGRHSTQNPEKLYYGSGTWIKQFKPKVMLKVEILEYADTYESLILLEEKHLRNIGDDPKNKNMNFPDSKGKFNRKENFSTKARELKLGKTFEEIYGEEAAQLIKNKISAKARVRKRHGMTGKTHSEETKLKISESNKGLTPWNKGKKSPQTTGSKNGFYGKTHSEETKKRMSEASLNKPVKTCQHCNKTLDIANFTRHHGDNCKFKDGNLLAPQSSNV